MAKRTYELDFKGSEEVIKKQAQLTIELRKTNAEIKKAQKAGNEQLYKGLTESQIKLKSEIQKTNAEIRNQKKEFESSKLPVDSIKALERSYLNLKNEVKELSKEERKSPFGKELIGRLNTVRNEINKTKSSIGDLSKSIASNFGQSLSQGIGFGGAAGLGFATAGLVKDSFNELIQLEKVYFQIRELTQASIADVALYQKEIPKLSAALGLSQVQLAQGIYQINSAGITGEKSLKLLAESARLSAIGFGDVNTVAGTLAGAINAYGGDVERISGTVKALFKLVQQGSGDVSSFASSFSKVTTLASQLNVPIDQLAGNIANITNKGTPASEAVTQLQSVFIGLLKPTKEGTEQLQKVNLSYDKLRRLASIDLAQALDLLNERLAGNSEAMAAVFGRSESLQGVFSNTGKNADGLKDIMSNLNKEFEGTSEVMERFNETNGQKITRFFNTLKNGAIDALGSFITFSEKFGNAYNKFIDIITFSNKKLKVEKPSNDQFDPFGADFLKQIEGFEKQDEFNKIVNEKAKITEEELKSIEKEKNKARQEYLRSQEKYRKEKIKSLEKEADELETITKRIKSINDESLRNEIEAAIQLKSLQNATTEVKAISPIEPTRTIDSSVKFVSTLLNVNQDDFDKQQKDIKAKREQLKQDLFETARELALIGLDAIQELALQDLDNKQKLVDEEKEYKLNALEEEYEKRRDYAQGNYELIKQLNEEQAEKQAAIEKEAAKRSQAINIKKAIVDGALAIVKTFASLGFVAGLPFALLQAATTAKQIALIKSQGFAEGGQPQTRIGAGYVQGPGTTTSDSIPALLSNKEYVLNAKMVELLGLDFLENMRRSTLGYAKVLTHPATRFAQGGSPGGSSFIPNINLPPVSQGQTTAVFDRDNMITFGEAVAGIVADEVQNALSKGLLDANARLQREAKQKQRSAA